MRARVFIGDMCRAFPALLITDTVLLAAMSVVDAASVLSIAPVIDLVIHPDLSGVSVLTMRLRETLERVGIPATLGVVLGLFLAFNVLKSLLYIAVRHSMLKTRYAMEREMLVGTFEDFFNARWHFFSSGHQGTFLNTFTREMARAGSAFGAITLVAATIVQIGVYLAIPLYLSWQVTIVSLAVAILLAAPFFMVGRLGYRLGQESTSTANTLGSILHESLGSAKVILGFGNQGRSIAELRQAFQRHVRATIASQTLGISMPHLYRPIGLLVVVIALLAARRLSVSLSETAALLYALMQVVPLVGVIAAEKSSLDVLLPSYEQAATLRRRARELRQRSGPRRFESFLNEIALEGVGFSYPGAAGTLVDLNVRIPKGRLIALVGESGAGKSTLVDILMGFNEPTAGRMTVDGMPFQEFDVVSYRKRIGYVPQDSVLLDRSIRDNLLWANESATDADIRHASTQAHAAEFIEQLPDGYDTIVGDRGVRLSGGERQRVALARAIVRKPALLVLDEATSNLDSRSERLIQEAIDSIVKEVTVVVIAHRLSTIMKADHIYVMRSGRIVEEGDYETLVQNRGYFAQMVALQSLIPVA